MTKTATTKKTKAKKTLFGAFLEENGIDYATAAEALDCTSAWIGMLARGNGGASPQLELSAKIEVYTKGKVPMASWLPPKLAEGLRKVAASRAAAALAHRRHGTETAR